MVVRFPRDRYAHAQSGHQGVAKGLLNADGPWIFGIGCMSEPTVPGHMKLLVTSRCVARMPGCDIQCSDSVKRRDVSASGHIAND